MACPTSHLFDSMSASSRLPQQSTYGLEPGPRVKPISSCHPRPALNQVPWESLP
jgi:hypothetical protein